MVIYLLLLVSIFNAMTIVEGPDWLGILSWTYPERFEKSGHTIGTFTVSLIYPDTVRYIVSFRLYGHYLYSWVGSIVFRNILVSCYYMRTINSWNKLRLLALFLVLHLEVQLIQIWACGNDLSRQF